MNYYRSTITGRYITAFDFQVLIDAYGKAFVENTVSEKTFMIANPPSVVELLKLGQVNMAYRRICELFPKMPAPKIVNLINLMQMDILKFKKGDLNEAEEH